MLDLRNSEFKEKAISVLNSELAAQIQSLGPIKLKFGGLSTFKDLDPTLPNPKLFFIDVLETSGLQKLRFLGNLLIRRCIESGIIDIEGKGGNYRFHRSILHSSGEGSSVEFEDDCQYLGPVKEKEKIGNLGQLPSEQEAEDGKRVCVIHSYPHVTVVTGCRPPNSYERFVKRCSEEMGGREAIESKWKDIVESRADQVCWRDLVKEFNLEMMKPENQHYAIGEVSVDSVDLSLMPRRGAPYPSDGGFEFVVRLDMTSSN